MYIIQCGQQHIDLSESKKYLNQLKNHLKLK